jgi:O-antigen/teichoic acid export membrane protein
LGPARGASGVRRRRLGRADATHRTGERVSEDAISQVAPPVEIAPQGLPDQAAVTTAAHAFDHRGERSRRLKWSILTSLLTKPLAVVTPIVIVPLFLHYLGTEGYGLFENVGALTIWLTLSNVGITMGLINRLTECHVQEDRELARRYVSTLALVLLALVAVMTLAVSVAVPLVDWSRVFKVDSPALLRAAPAAVWVSAMITLWGMWFSFPQPIYAAYQENHRHNLWDGASKVLTLAACVLVIYTPLGLVGVILAAAGVNLFVRVVNVLWMFGWEKPWLRPAPRFFDRALLYGTLKQGFGLFVISTAAISIFQVDKLIIGKMLGQGAVAEYSVIGRPFMLVFGVYSLLLAPLWPLHGEALRRGDVEWVRRVLRLSVLAGCGGIVACGAAMFFFGDWIVTVWTRGEFVAVSRPLVAAMTALFVLWTGMASLSIVLNSAGVLRAQMWFISLHGLSNVILAVALAKPYGVTGVAWSMTITGLLTSVWGYPWMLRKYIFQRNWTATPVRAA